MLAGVAVVAGAAWFLVSNGSFTARLAPTGWTQTSGGSSIAQTSGGPHQPAVASALCGDGVCAPALGETTCSCPSDCTTSICGTVWDTPAHIWSSRSGFSTVIHNGKIFVIGGYPDPQGGNSTSDAWSSSDGIAWTRVTTSSPWLFESQAVSFNGRIWMSQHSTPFGFIYSNLFSSLDGAAWNFEATLPFLGAQFVVFNNRIWALGTRQGTYLYTSQVWSSSDGITWTQVNSSAPWSPRYSAGITVFNNKLWIIEGASPNPYPNNNVHNVWSSSDGITWTQANSFPPFLTRYAFGATSLDGKMWIYGGYTNSCTGSCTFLSDVWSSSDGITWTQATPAAPWGHANGFAGGSPGRFNFGAVAFNNQLWVMGGTTISVTNANINSNDVWQTTP